MKRRTSGGTCQPVVLIAASLMLVVMVTSVHAEWMSVNPPSVSSEWGIADVFFPSPDFGWAVGQDAANQRGLILRFFNGTWTAIASSALPFVSTNWELTGVHFAGSDQAWAVGTDIANRRGVLLRFSNGAWTSVAPPEVSLNWELRHVFFSSPTTGWAVGRDSINRRGVVLGFSNGAWGLAALPEMSSDWELSGVHFTSAAQGWLVGTDFKNKKGIVLQFDNSQFPFPPWISRSLPGVSSDWELSALHFTSSGEGWAVGRDSTNKRGVILQYGNGYVSGSWSSISSLPEVSPDWELLDLHFRTADSGWAVGRDSANKEGVILQFSEGIWTAVSAFPEVSSEWNLWAIQSTDTDDGWAVGKDFVGDKGVLLRYAVPRVSVSPTKISFQDVTTGLYLDKEVSVRNSGRGSLVLGTITSPSAPFVKKADLCSGVTLGPQSSCKVTYRFSPSSEGTFTSSSNIPSNDPQKELMTVTLSGNGVSGTPVTVYLVNPPDAQEADACSYDAPFAFQWDPSETLKSAEIRFSLQEDFSAVPIKVKAKKGATELVISSSTWKKVLLLPGPGGGTVYWMVAGTTGAGAVDSDVFSILVIGTEPVLAPSISPTSKATPPTLSWQNNCNLKFKAWFGNDPDFTKAGMKKKSLSFSVKNPADGGGVFTRTLTEGQWKSIRSVVGDESGQTIYWYVESSDALKRSSNTDVISFVLTD